MLPVERKDAVIIFHLIFVQRASAHADAGVADNTVQPAVLFYSRIDQRTNVFGLAAIGPDKNGFAAFLTDGVGYSLSLVGAARRTDDPDPIDSIHLRDGAANPPAGAGDDGNFSLHTAKILFHTIPFCGMTAVYV